MYVYVVYNVAENALDNVQVFADHKSAKWFVEHAEGNYKIWQKPLVKDLKYIDGEMTLCYE